MTSLGLESISNIQSISRRCKHDLFGSVCVPTCRRRFTCRRLQQLFVTLRQLFVNLTRQPLGSANSYQHRPHQGSKAKGRFRSGRSCWWLMKKWIHAQGAVDAPRDCGGGSANNNVTDNPGRVMRAPLTVSTRGQKKPLSVSSALITPPTAPAMQITPSSAPIDMVLPLRMLLHGPQCSQARSQKSNCTTPRGKSCLKSQRLSMSRPSTEGKLKPALKGGMTQMSWVVT